MLKKPKTLSLILLGFTLLTVIIYVTTQKHSKKSESNILKEELNKFLTDDTQSLLSENIEEFNSQKDELIPIQIEYLKSQTYRGSEINIEETLSPGSNYQRYIASYYSEDLKQYGLLTIPNETMPKDGFPAIIFNHGYIDPQVYKTTERYEAYTDYFSSRGYVLFKPDYRGHDKSEGIALGGYANSDYITDVLNAFVSIQNLESVDSNRVGMWGHSMGGWITHRAMVVNEDIKAGVIWAGMVGGYDDLLELREPWWVRRGIPPPEPDPQNPQRRWRSYLTETYGPPQENKEFWQSISAVTYLDQLSGPIQLHHATGDESVPFELSERFFENIQKNATPQTAKDSQMYIYQGDDHNIGQNFGSAMQNSIDFFERHLN